MTAFVAEDGTGLATATSYVDLDFSNTYLGASWADDDTAKQNALIAATEYADARWGRKLRSEPLLSTQALEMPRFALYDRYGIQIEGVPNEWAKGVCLYAQSYVAGTLYPVPDTSTAQNVKRKKTQVGPVLTEVEYQGAATDASWLRFPIADALMKMFTGSGNSAVMRN